MFKIAAVSTALVMVSGACGSPEAPMQLERVVQPDVQPKQNSESLSPGPRAITGLSRAALEQVLEERLHAFRSVAPTISSSLTVLQPNETILCKVKEEKLEFTLNGNDTMAGYNCVDDKTIVLSEAFISTHFATSSKPRTAAQIFFGHELGHTIMGQRGVDPLTTDKTNGERMADCLAGTSFSALSAEEHANFKTVFSEILQSGSDDISGRETAFASGLAGETCSLS